jgi:ABC-type branched-subunit amino acid transport system ATPase component/branched-subunit amino acid ABC-type transport system permease component
MSEHVNFLLLGLANGAVFAAIGLALVVTYRSSGVMNFATSAIGLFSAYNYASLRRGEFLILVPGLPRSVRFGHQLGFWPAALGALVLTAVFGLLLYAIVFRPLRGAPMVARAVASLGVMMLLTGLMTVRQGTAPPPVAKIFPQGRFRIGDVVVSKDRVYFAAALVALALVVWAITRFTRFGLKTRAAAATQKGAYLSGISPDRIAALNWMLSAVVAGIAGILIAPIVPLLPIQYTLFIVPGLAAAILGRFERLAPVVAGGLAIGMLQSEVSFLQVTFTWLPSAGLSEAVPLILILVVLVLRAKSLPSRGVVLRSSLGRAPRPRKVWMSALLGVAVGVTALVATSGITRASLVTSLIFAVIALSYVVVTGYSGQISLAQLTLAGAAGFLLAPLTSRELPLFGTTLPFPLAPIAAALGATLIGVLIAIPAVRVRGLPVAVVTLALAALLEAGWFRNSHLVDSAGEAVAGPSLFGLDLSSGLGTAEFPRLGFSFMVLVVLAIVAVGVAFLRRSRLGTSMLSVRANERSAAAAGIDVVRTKIIAFAIGAFLAGLGGALLAYKQGVAVPDSYTLFLGLVVFATAYLAGITSISGGIAAGLMCASGLVYTAFDHWLDLGQWYSTISGLALVLTVVLHPEGVVGPIHSFVARRRARSRSATGVLSGVEASGELPFTAVTGRRTPSAPVPDGGPPVLALRGVGVTYGGVTAAQEVTFDVPAGKIVGLIGPNGAGKTTVIDAITGLTKSIGTVELHGEDIGALAPFQRVRRGLGRTFQAIELYDDLSVAENVIVGQAASRAKDLRDQLDRTLALLGLETVRDVTAGELSQGTRQLVSIARALVGAPDVLLLDEPAGGLDSRESQWLGYRLSDIAGSGVAVLLVDHDMQLVLDVCDEIQVLDFGEIIAAGAPAEVRADAKVKEAYLGGITEVRAPEDVHAGGAG